MFNLEVPDSIQMVLKFFAHCENPSSWESQIRRRFKTSNTTVTEKMESFLAGDFLAMVEAFKNVRILHIRAYDIEERHTSPTDRRIGTIVADRCVVVTVTSDRYIEEDSENYREFEVEIELVRLMRGTENVTTGSYHFRAPRDTNWRIFSAEFFHNDNVCISFSADNL